ncbi:hypothetical protein NDU88_003629 [Pleurodeles waltl]|uniref:Uncharacterized protein n=1 Tax=Pleurodeles waltl TaxID=8319 RepID=A0AAV7TP51_PLEWA|nr:hypothetical protein NDU88_003629 [Pleurodeles waltl]
MTLLRRTSSCVGCQSWGNSDEVHSARGTEGTLPLRPLPPLMWLETDPHTTHGCPVSGVVSVLQALGEQSQFCLAVAMPPSFFTARGVQTTAAKQLMLLKHGESEGSTGRENTLIKTPHEGPEHFNSAVGGRIAGGLQEQHMDTTLRLNPTRKKNNNKQNLINATQKEHSANEDP